ncbi:MAG: hypothetical protein OXB93_05980 [Cytophagales bacterium]|nr:hypothetical protein [Cytophagales bacterium]
MEWKESLLKLRLQYPWLGTRNKTNSRLFKYRSSTFFGLLCEKKEGTAARMSELLHQDGKKLSILCLPGKIAKKETKENSHSEVLLKWNGTPQSVSLDKFLSLPFNGIINLLESNSPQSEYVIRKSDAELKVRVLEKNSPAPWEREVYDLVFLSVKDKTRVVDYLRRLG